MAWPPLTSTTLEPALFDISTLGWDSDVRRSHGNPAIRCRGGLVESPDLWRWSSYRVYFLGETGIVKINKWDVLKMKIRMPAA